MKRQIVMGALLSVVVSTAACYQELSKEELQQLELRDEVYETIALAAEANGAEPPAVEPTSCEQADGAVWCETTLVDRGTESESKWIGCTWDNCYCFGRWLCCYGDGGGMPHCEIYKY